jgi:hypothetical protein
MAFCKNAFSIIFAVGLLTSIYPLTSGPMQPEFTSFEPVDVTDMVNLPTGDFTYVLPLGEVKGPAGVGYPVVLSYHAGIENEQEASWVGLGWTLNVGAINRQVVGFPDDYFYAKSSSYLLNPGESGSSTTLGLGWGGFDVKLGWTNKGFQGITGFGKSFVGINVGYDRMQGAHVGLNYGPFGMSFGQGKAPSYSVGAGINSGAANIGADMSFGGGQEPVFCAHVGLMNKSLFSIASKNDGSIRGSYLGHAPGINSAYSDKGMKVYENSECFSLFGPYGISLSYASYSWGWRYQEMHLCQGYGYLYHSSKLDFIEETYDPLLPDYYSKYGNSQPWKYQEFLQTVNGPLAKKSIENATTTMPGTGFNPFIYVQKFDDKLEYINSCDVNLPAQDIYAVSGQGISGVFKPFALKSLNTCFSSAPEKDGLFYKDSANKVPFNNNPMHFSPFYKDGIVFKMISENAMNLVDDADLGNDSYSSNDLMNIHIKDNGAGKVTGTQITPLFGTRKADYCLEGFIVTDVEGKRYYYTLPLKSFSQIIVSSSSPMVPQSLIANSGFSYVNNSEPYATTWLLTAITGPDYVKIKGNINSVDEDLNYGALLPWEGDLGYWVKFNYEYNDYNRKVSMLWRNPYKDFIKNPCESQYTTAFGQKEITYLRSIETPSEIAYFRTKDRLDGKGLKPSDYPVVSQPYEATCVFANIKTLSVYISGKLQNVDIPYDFANSIKHHYVTETGTVRLKGVSRAWYDSFKPGDPLMQLNIGGEVLWSSSSIAPWCWGWYRESTCSGALTVIKDPSGTNMPPGGGDPWTNSLGQQICRITPYIRCSGITIDDATGDITLSITPYQFNFNDQTSRVSGAFLNSESPGACGSGYEHRGVSVQSAIIYNASFISNPDSVKTTQKYLSEIAWYSKSLYPYIAGGIDPSIPENQQKCRDNGLPVPQSYRKVKFDYTYDLAPATTNSEAPNGGRLTLKGVTIYAGPEDASLSLPPYVFSYQQQSAPYLGPDKADPWGYRKEDPDGPQDISDQGVNWNLSKINLPSGGSMEIEYGRDSAYSSLSQIYRLKRDPAFSCNGFEGSFKPPDVVAPALPYFDDYTVSSYNKETKQITLTSISGIEEGSHFIAYCHVQTSSQEPKDLDCNHDAIWTKTKNLYSYRYLYRIVKILSATNSIVVDQEIPDGIEQISVLRKQKILCDGVRVKRIISNSGLDQTTTRYTYPESGVLHLLPGDATSKLFTKKYVTSSTTGVCQCVDDAPDCQEEVYTEHARYIDFGYSTDIESNYNDGNTSIVYPMVDVYQVDKNDNPINGMTRYTFWTYEDMVTVAGKDVPLIHIKKDLRTLNYLPVTQIWDRSGIVGMVKRVEYWENTGNKIIYEKTNKYVFSEELAGKAGVVFKSLSNTPITDNSPLGMVRQRSKRIDETGTIKNIADLIISKPFLIGVTEKKDGVVYNTDFGMFDAFTGAPMVTVATNTDGNKKMAANIPYYYLASTSDKSNLEKKNIYSLPGGAMTENIKHLNITKTADITYANLIQISDSIKSASSQAYGEEEYTNASDVPFSQYRFMPTRNYSWQGVTASAPAFDWPVFGGKNWLKVSEITSVDRFSRPQTEVNGLDEPVASTVVYHPRMNVVSGVVQNASYEECGVFTCDYSEQNPLTPGYLDRGNGWEKPAGTELSDFNHAHFGKKSVMVTNSFGPSRNFKLEKGKDYIASAWVACPSSEYKVLICCDYRYGPKNLQFPYSEISGYNDNNHPERIKAIKFSGKFQTNECSWVRLEIFIEAGYDLDKRDWNNYDWFIRLFVGTKDRNGTYGTAYVDDIRFYPKDAHVSSYYYDQDLGVPIAFVDENGKAKYFEYDVFGRLKNIKNNSGQVLSTADYNNSISLGYIEISYPKGGETFISGSTLPVAWNSYGNINNVSVKYSTSSNGPWTSIVENIPNTGSSTWVLPPEGGSYWIRIENNNNSYPVAVLEKPIIIINNGGKKRSFIEEFIMKLFGHL